MEDSYTTNIKVIRQAGLYDLQEVLVSELKKTGNIYAVVSHQILNTQDYYVLSDTRQKIAVVVNEDDNTFETPVAIKTTDTVIYPTTSANLDEINDAIEDAKNHIDAKLEGYDKTAGVLSRIATWLAAGYIKSKETGFTTDSGEFKNEGTLMIEKAEKWLKMELERQRKGGTIGYGKSVVEDSDIKVELDNDNRC